MDYDSTLKLCFLLGFLCCWLISLTIRAVTGAVRLFLLRMEVRELCRQVEQLEYFGEHPPGDGTSSP